MATQYMIKWNIGYGPIEDGPFEYETEEEAVEAAYSAAFEAFEGSAVWSADEYTGEDE